MFEQIAHLEVVHPIRVQVDVGHRLDDGEQTVAAVQLFNLVVEIEAVENVARCLREAVDKGDEVGGDVLGIAQQALESEWAGVEQRLLARRVRRAGKHPLHRVSRHILSFKLLILRQHGILCRLQHAVEPPQHHQRQHHEAVLRGAVGAAKAIGNFPDCAGKLLVMLDVHRRFLVGDPSECPPNDLCCSKIAGNA
jgi:hypothetical protein